MKNRGLFTSIVAIPLAGLLLAGCATGDTSGTSSSDEAPANGKIELVTTTNVYGQIAREIGGERVAVTEIITSPAQDPHSYEPTARDKLTVSKASVVLANGGGYDQFMDSLVSSLPADKADQVHLIHAVDSSPVAKEHDDEPAHDEHAADEHAADEHAGHDHAADEHSADEHAGHDHAEYNEHIWYDLDSMQALATELAAELGHADPEGASGYEANANTFVQGIKDLREQLTAAKLAGHTYAMTEPVPFHLLEDAGMKNKTPAGLSEAVEGGAGIAPLSLKDLSDSLKAGKIDVLAYNVQTEGAETASLRANAETGQVPVVDFRETITDDSDYLVWMKKNIDALSSAING
ncbi:zinc ABC transporter substrate-binding protein [Arthrobacter sp. MYb213]|uniref:metal ABC transporter solute-binding protein, Zn/Mn family n=1 Tax=Arthrobacter sp. MYb213 TaxID=1848595 RepID=UPI000CFD423A|nr:zinc ABC transporter substrate-binding protein [Arthrobacter sp. MYb213]PRB71631.1 ABC transporter substrate-binding protein [Arthrobacter sp. MYb213]